MPSKSVVTAYVDLQLHTAQFKAAIDEASSSMRTISASMRAESEKSRESVRVLSEKLGLEIPRGVVAHHQPIARRYHGDKREYGYPSDGNREHRQLNG
jgi:hypothetical protein